MPPLRKEEFMNSDYYHILARDIARHPEYKKDPRVLEILVGLRLACHRLDLAAHIADPVNRRIALRYARFGALIPHYISWATAPKPRR